MKPAQYFEPKLGQSLLYPGQAQKYLGQCVQSVMLWLAATGTTPPAYPSAFMYYLAGIPGYTKIPAGPAIQDADIIVWGSDFPPSNGNGHIDVATGDGTLKDFWAYDSNWQPPLKLSKIHHNGSDNRFIIGYLRKTKEGDTMPEDYLLNSGDNANVKAEFGFKTEDAPDLTGQPWKSVYYNWINGKGKAMQARIVELEKQLADIDKGEAARKLQAIKDALA